MRTELRIDRVIILGATGDALKATDLGAMVERAIQQAIASATPPSGRAMHSTVVVKSGPLTSGASIAGAVANGVSQAMSGGRAHG